MLYPNKIKIVIIYKTFFSNHHFSGAAIRNFGFGSGSRRQFNFGSSALAPQHWVHQVDLLVPVICTCSSQSWGQRRAALFPPASGTGPHTSLRLRRTTDLISWDIGTRYLSSVFFSVPFRNYKNAILTGAKKKLMHGNLCYGSGFLSFNGLVSIPKKCISSFHFNILSTMLTRRHCCGSGMFIPDLGSEFFHPRSQIQGQRDSGSRIRSTARRIN